MDMIGNHPLILRLQAPPVEMHSILPTAALLAGLLLMSGSVGFKAGSHEEKSGTSSSEGTSKPKAKKVYTNEDLKSLPDTTRINQVPPKPPDPKARNRGIGIEGYRDKDGHDREFWQKKVRPLNHQLEALDSQIGAQQAKYDRLNAASGVKVSRSGKLSTSSSDTKAQAAKRLEELKQKRAEVLKSRRDLEEEARKAQALPEWLR